VRLRRVEEGLVDLGLRDEALEVGDAPLARRELLEEGDELLERERLERRGKVEEERRADLDVEGVEALAHAVPPFRDARVPEPDRERERELAEEEAVHPAKGKRVEFDAVLFEVVHERLCRETGEGRWGGCEGWRPS
jgi:hypothetical protein